MMRKAALPLVLVSLVFAGCASTDGYDEENEPTLIEAASDAAAEPAAAIEPAATEAEAGSKQEEGEVPLAVAQSEQPEQPAENQTPENQPPEEVVVQGRRHEVIHDLVAEAQTLLRDVELQYVFTGKGRREI